MPGKTKKTIGVSKRGEIANMAEAMCKRKDVHFSKQECERLLQLYKELNINQNPELKGRGKGGVDRVRFRDILHQHFNMTDDALMDKVFKAFDLDNDSFISKEEWLLGMSIFLKGTQEEKSKFCFGVYRTRVDDNYITRDEMFHLLKSCLVQQSQEEDPDEMPKDLVEWTLKKMDHDHDGRLSLDDYINAVKEEELLIEALGPCLPCTKSRDTFLEMVADEHCHQMY